MCGNLVFSMRESVVWAVLEGVVKASNENARFECKQFQWLNQPMPFFKQARSATLL